VTAGSGVLAEEEHVELSFWYCKLEVVGTLKKYKVINMRIQEIKRHANINMLITRSLFSSSLVFERQEVGMLSELTGNRLDVPC